MCLVVQRYSILAVLRYSGAVYWLFFVFQWYIMLAVFCVPLGSLLAPSPTFTLQLPCTISVCSSLHLSCIIHSLLYCILYHALSCTALCITGTIDRNVLCTVPFAPYSQCLCLLCCKFLLQGYYRLLSKPMQDEPFPLHCIS